MSFVPALPSARSSARRSRAAIALPAFAVVLIAALAAPAAAQRPAPGDGYDPAVELFSVDSDGPNIRVWYVTESADAVQVGDTAPADGIPDFAVEVAAMAEISHETYAAMGFRPPLVDADLLPAAQVGGDGRFDIYLANFGQADGSYEVDACTDLPFACAGYILMENDFAGFGYPSDSIAIKTLTSHEYFHAVQHAYDANQDIKWSEGTAVWAEEQVFPEQPDFEAFLPYFLDKPHRAFDRPSGASFGDLYPYGAALWPTFLTERFGPDAVLQVWTLCEEDGEADRDFLTAADVLLADGGSSLREAWIEFTQWNLFTGPRADPSRAYLRGADWGTVAMEPDVTAGADGSFEVEFQIEGMSARYLPVVLPDVGGAPRELSIVTEALPNPAAAAVGTAYFAAATGGALGDAIPLEPDPAQPGRAVASVSWTGEASLVVVTTGVSRGAPMRTVRVALAAPEDEPPTEDTGGCRAAGSGDAVWLIGLALVGLRRRRRRS